MTSLTRWQRRKSARPQEILDAALDLFAERGFAATRMDDIAARAGVTKGTVYLYFKTKDDLFKELVRSILLKEVEQFEVTAESYTATELLQQMAIRWVTEIVPSKGGALPKIIVAESGNFPELTKFYQDEFVVRVLMLVRLLLNRGIQTGEFRPIDVEQAAYVFVAPLWMTAIWTHSLASYANHPIDAIAIGRTHLDLFIASLCPNLMPASPPLVKSRE